MKQVAKGPFIITRVISIVLGIGICFLFQEMMLAPQFNIFTRILAVRAALYVTLAVSLNLINGITGQFSIGHFAFYQIGAYTAGALSKAFFASSPLLPMEWIPTMMIAGACVASFAGLVVGMPSLRLRGDYLAIVTLGFGEIVRITTINIPYVGGASGMSVTPNPSNPAELIFFAFGLAVITIAVCRNLLKTSHGLAFLAIREDEIASSAMGIPTTKFKVLAFVIGAAFAGAAGGLNAHFIGSLRPEDYTMDNSFIVLTMVQLGGVGSITGSTLAAIVLFYLPELLRSLQSVPMPIIIFALIAIFISVALIRKEMAKFPDTSGKSSMAVALTHLTRYAVALIPGILIAIVGPSLIHAFVPLNSPNAFLSFISFGKTIQGNQLRMPIFAVALVVTMLLRPQGILANKEFSWSMFKRKSIPATPGVA